MWTWYSLVDTCRIRRIRAHLSDAVDARHATCDRTDLPPCQTERSGEQDWKSLGDPPLWRWSRRTRNHNLFLRVLHRRGGRVFLTFPWTWNVLTTWPIQSVLNEAPFLCAREGKKGILTNCVDTARLVGRSRCCKSLVSQRLVQS